MKYKEWLHDWLELYEKESVKPRTYKQYEDVINKRLIPALGDYEMEDLSPIILQRYIVDLSQKGNTKTGKGLAPNSVNCIILVLHSSLSMAYVQLSEELERRFMAAVKRMKLAFNLCSASDKFTDEDKDYIHFYCGVRSILFKLTKGDAPDIAQMNARVREMLEGAIQSDGIEELFETGKHM